MDKMASDPWDGTSKTAIGNRLVLTREVMGLAAKDFAAAADIAPSTYSNYEIGLKRPSVDNALGLCEQHELTLDWIYRGDPDGLPMDLRRAIREALRVRRSAN